MGVGRKQDVEEEDEEQEEEEELACAVSWLGWLDVSLVVIEAEESKSSLTVGSLDRKTGRVEVSTEDFTFVTVATETLLATESAGFIDSTSGCTTVSLDMAASSVSVDCNLSTLADSSSASSWLGMNTGAGVSWSVGEEEEGYITWTGSGYTTATSPPIPTTPYPHQHNQNRQYYHYF